MVLLIFLAPLSGGCGGPQPVDPDRARVNVIRVEPDRPGPFVGEVVELGCYLGQGARGAAHAPCAAACLKRGVPAGLLTDDGQLLVLIPEVKPGATVEFSAFAARRCRVEGKLVQRASAGGIRGLVVTSIAEAPAP